MEVCAGCTQPAATVQVAVEAPEALLLETVHIVGRRITGLLRRVEKGLDQRVFRRAALDG